MHPHHPLHSLPLVSYESDQPREVAGEFELGDAFDANGDADDVVGDPVACGRPQDGTGHRGDTTQHMETVHTQSWGRK